jgi:hypothetical protein
VLCVENHNTHALTRLNFRPSSFYCFGTIALFFSSQRPELMQLLKRKSHTAARVSERPAIPLFWSARDKHTVVVRDESCRLCVLTAHRAAGMRSPCVFRPYWISPSAVCSGAGSQLDLLWANITGLYCVTQYSQAKSDCKAQIHKVGTSGCFLTFLFF